MILANVAAARQLKQSRAGGLFRVHGVPEEKKLDQLLTQLAAIGVDAELPEEVQPRDLRKITERAAHSIDLPFIESLVVRSMPQAVYQPANIGHFGLALEEYAHFTSPIRRYPDLVVHRALRAIIDARDPAAVRYEASELGVMGQDLSRLEKRADESDRYVDGFLKCSYLRERLGQVFDGLITTVVEYGCFVQLRGIGIDGLLRLDALQDDEYVMSADGHAWLARRRGLRLGIGTAVRVMVTNANPVEGLIDLELDDAPPVVAATATRRAPQSARPQRHSSAHKSRRDKAR